MGKRSMAESGIRTPKNVSVVYFDQRLGAAHSKAALSQVFDAKKKNEAKVCFGLIPKALI